MINLGTVKPGSTIEIPFETFAGSTGAPITMTGLAASVTNIKVFKDGSVTERASASGYTLLDTDGIDFDGLTGIHGFTIDLADNTTADFWASGSRYTVVVTALTVDSQTVRFVAATFRIGYVGAALDTTIATLASQTSFTLTAGPADDNALIGCVALIHDAASAVQIAQGVVSAYTGSTKTVTLAVDPAIFTMAAKDNIAFFPRVNVHAVGGTAQTARDLGTSVLLSSGTGTGQVDLSSGTVKLQATTHTGAVIPTVTTTTTATNLTNAPTSGDLTATMKASVTTAATAATPTAAAVTGAVGSVTGNVGGNVVGSVASVAGAVGSVTGNVGGNVTGSVGSVLAGVTLAASAIQAIWDAATSALTTVGSIGKWVVDKLDVVVSTRLATASYTAPLDAAGTRTAIGLASANLDTQLDALPTAAENQSGMATAANLATLAGYVDTEVAAIKAVTDKLDTALELDAAVYRFTTNALEQAPSGGGGTDWTADEKTAIKTILGVPATGTAPDEPSAGALKVIDDFLDTEVAAIKAKTDNLPASPAATGDIPSAASIRSEMDTNSTKLSDILTDTAVIGAAGAGLTAVPWNASWDSEVQSEVTDALVAYDPPTKAELDSAVAPLATAAGVSAVETDTQDIQSRIPNALTGAGNIKADAQVVSDKTGYALTTAPLTAAETRTAVGLASANLDTQIGAVATNATTAATQSTAAASSALTAATQATNSAADALQTKKLMEAMPILDTSTTPWTLKLIQQGTGTSGANYLDGTVLRTLYLYTAAGVAVTVATQVVGSQRDS